MMSETEKMKPYSTAISLLSPENKVKYRYLLDNIGDFIEVNSHSSITKTINIPKEKAGVFEQHSNPYSWPLMFNLIRLAKIRGHIEKGKDVEFIVMDNRGNTLNMGFLNSAKIREGINKLGNIVIDDGYKI